MGWRAASALMVGALAACASFGEAPAGIPSDAGVAAADATLAESSVPISDASTDGPDAPDAVPPLFTDCRLWLRADRGLSLGADDRVVAWIDQHGTANDIHDGTHDVKPAVGGDAGPRLIAEEATLGGRPAINFEPATAGASLLRSAIWSTELKPPFTIYVVAVGSPTAEVHPYVIDGVKNGQATSVWVKSDIGANGGGTLDVHGVLSVGTPFVIAAVFGGGSSSLSLNQAAASGIGSLGNNALVGTTIGNDVTGMGPFGGRIAEVLVYAGGHDEKARAAVMADYLAPRYKIHVER